MAEFFMIMIYGRFYVNEKNIIYNRGRVHISPKRWILPGLPERKVDLKRKTAAKVVSAAVLFYGIEKRPLDLCPFGKDIQVIAVHITLVTLPSRVFIRGTDTYLPQMRTAPLVTVPGCSSAPCPPFP